MMSKSSSLEYEDSSHTRAANQHAVAWARRNGAEVNSAYWFDVFAFPAQLPAERTRSSAWSLGGVVLLTILCAAYLSYNTYAWLTVTTTTVTSTLVESCTKVGVTCRCSSGCWVKAPGEQAGKLAAFASSEVKICPGRDGFTDVWCRNGIALKRGTSARAFQFPSSVVDLLVLPGTNGTIAAMTVSGDTFIIDRDMAIMHHVLPLTSTTGFKVLSHSTWPTGTFLRTSNAELELLQLSANGQQLERLDLFAVNQADRAISWSFDVLDSHERVVRGSDGSGFAFRSATSISSDGTAVLAHATIWEGSTNVMSQALLSIPIFGASRFGRPGRNASHPQPIGGVVSGVNVNAILTGRSNNSVVRISNQVSLVSSTWVLYQAIGQNFSHYPKPSDWFVPLAQMWSNTDQSIPQAYFRPDSPLTYDIWGLGAGMASNLAVLGQGAYIYPPDLKLEDQGTYDDLFLTCTSPFPVWDSSTWGTDAGQCAQCEIGQVSDVYIRKKGAFYYSTFRGHFWSVVPLPRSLPHYPWSDTIIAPDTRARHDLHFVAYGVFSNAPGLLVPMPMGVAVQNASVTIDTSEAGHGISRGVAFRSEASRSSRSRVSVPSPPASTEPPAPGPDNSAEQRGGGTIAGHQSNSADFHIVLGTSHPVGRVYRYPLSDYGHVILEREAVSVAGEPMGAFF